MQPRRSMLRGTRVAGTASAAAVALCLLAGGGTAYAYWATTGAGSGAAAAATMQAVTVDAFVAGDSNRTSLVPGGSADVVLRTSNPNAFAVQLYSVASSGAGHRRCRPCRMHHHRGVLHCPGRAARTCRHHPGTFFPAGHPARRGQHVHPVTVRLPGRDLQSSRHRGGTTMSRRNTRQARPRPEPHRRHRCRRRPPLMGRPGGQRLLDCRLKWRHRGGRRRRRGRRRNAVDLGVSREMSRWRGMPAPPSQGVPSAVTRWPAMPPPPEAPRSPPGEPAQARSRPGWAALTRVFRPGPGTTRSPRCSRSGKEPRAPERRRRR